MILGLADVEESLGGADDQECCGSSEKRKRKALKHLGRAHRTGALAAFAAGDVQQLGALDPNAWIPSPKEVDAEESEFDGRLNAWLVDYQQAAVTLPAALVAQIDDFVDRWRNRSTFWILSARKAEMVIGFESEWNRFVDQVASYGHKTSVQPATVTVDGKEYRADQQPPPPPGTFDRIESIVKWGGIIVGGVALYKVASELGLVSRLGRMIGGGGGVRRYGSARRSNPRKRKPGKRRAEWVSRPVWDLLTSAEKKMVYTDAEFGDYMSFPLERARRYLERERRRPGHPVSGLGPKKIRNA